MSLLKLEIDQNRVYGLDILRAIAILAVVFDHSSLVLYQPYFKYVRIDGVSIFFVLSGYLVGGIFIKLLEKNQSLRFTVLLDFWKRRWFRTVPAYFLILFILTLLALFFTKGFELNEYWTYFFFIQNLNSPHPYIFFPEAWSLSIEEWFYLSMPLITFCLMHLKNINSKKAILLASLIMVLFSVFIRYTRFLEYPIQNLVEWDLLFRRQVITRLDSLMLGVLASFFYYYYRGIWEKMSIIFFAIGFIIFASLHFFIVTESYKIDFFLCVIYFPLHALSVALLLPLLSQIKAPVGGRLGLYTIITYISLSSYSMYLINLSLVQGWLIPIIPFDPATASTFLILFRYVLYWFVTVIGSILLYKYFEKPIMNLRERSSSKVGA